MSIPGWKGFNFFEKEGPLRAEQHSIPQNTTCCASGDGEIVFGCQDGRAVIVDQQLRCAVSWPAHSGRLVAMQVVPGRRMLATVGEEEVGPGASTLKLWDMGKIIPSTGNPDLIRGVKLFQKAVGAKEATQLSVRFVPSPGQTNRLSGTSTVAVGLSSGEVLLIRGEMGKERLQRARVLLGAPGSNPGACAGLELALPQEGAEDMVLFAVTERSTVSLRVAEALQTTGQRVTVSPAVLDDDGVSSDNCCCISPKGELVVGRTPAVYFYQAEGRGACFVFQGEKKHLRYMRHYLVLLSGPSSGASGGLAAGMDLSETAVDSRLVLSVQDLKNKLGAARVEVPAVKHLAVEWGVIVAVLEDGSVLKLKERDLAQKLSMLFRKNMYSVALQLAEAEEADQSTVADIQRKLGDHMYTKNDYDAAMAAYGATIGHLEPSYVIRRFLDVQRIGNLTHYLEKLHHARLANADHTTLLLNCYTKLKDITKLDDFIRGNSEENEAPKFDTETAVRVCRAAGYYEHGLYVALHANEPTWYLDILVEDCANYEEALAYIGSLPRPQASEALQKYGKSLVNHRPEQTTALLMKLCTPAHDTMGTPGVFTTQEAESVASFAHLYADRPLALMLLCEFILNSSTAAQPPASEMLLYHTLVDLYLAQELKDAPGPGDTPLAETPPSPTGNGRRQRREKALGLLKSGWPMGQEARYDVEHMLVLCRMHSFTDGLLFLYEKNRLYREVLGIYMSAKDFNGLIDACIRLGDASTGGDPQLWTEVLTYFAELPDGEGTSQLKEVLEHIEAGQLLPPLIVLQTMAKNPSLKLGMVKDYIGRQLEQSNASIQADRDTISKYQTETQRMKEEVEELQSKARVFQASKCASTGEPLQVPAVHFLCGHSFSMKSLGDNDSECPLCSPQHRTVLDIRRSMRAGANEQDRFFTALKNSADGFSVIAEYFGRGLVNAASHRTGGH